MLNNLKSDTMLIFGFLKSEIELLIRSKALLEVLLTNNIIQYRPKIFNLYAFEHK